MSQKMYFTVQSDFDRTFRFSNLKSFSFAVQRRATTDPPANDTLNDGRIRTGLELKDVDKKITKSTEKLVKQFMKDSRM